MDTALIWDIVIIDKGEKYRELYEKFFRNVNLEVLTVHNNERFYRLIDTFNNDVRLRLWIHLDMADYSKGPYTGEVIALNLSKKYKNIRYQFITSGSIQNREIKTGEIKLYDLASLPNINIESLPVNTKTTILDAELPNPDIQEISLNDKDKKIDLAIITALHDSEFENVKTEFNLQEDTTSKDTQKLLCTGHMKNHQNKSLKIIAGWQIDSGIVDAAILTTEIIAKYNPKYIAMTGVCGGRPEPDNELKSGDIIVAKELFSFQKGKFTENGFEPEIDHCEIDTRIIQLVEHNKTTLARKVMDQDTSRSEQYRKFPLEVFVEPMSSVPGVYDEKGRFKKEISTKDRKIIAIDMESYAVARACKIANNGETKAIIIKSIMDKTENKRNSEGLKPYAAFTSAAFLKYLARDVLEF